MLISLKAAGTKTHLIWIPSHVGIPGNTHADKLANDIGNIPTNKTIKNILTSQEIIALYKKEWSTSTLNDLKKMWETKRYLQI